MRIAPSFHSPMGVLPPLTINYDSIRVSSSPSRLDSQTYSGIMVTTINDNMYSAEVMHDPYHYYGQIRGEDPVHWNELYETWVITRQDDLVWLTRNHEQFSNSVLAKDPRPPYPAINDSDPELYDFMKAANEQRFIQYDRPDHLEMRKVMHGYFTPKSMEEWRPLVRSAIKDLLDAAEESGDVDLMRDLAVPLPVTVMVIASSSISNASEARTISSAPAPASCTSCAWAGAVRPRIEPPRNRNVRIISPSQAVLSLMTEGAGQNCLRLSSASPVHPAQGRTTHCGQVSWLPDRCGPAHLPVSRLARNSGVSSGSLPGYSCGGSWSFPLHSLLGGSGSGQAGSATTPAILARA